MRRVIRLLLVAWFAVVTRYIAAGAVAVALGDAVFAEVARYIDVLILLLLAMSGFSRFFDTVGGADSSLVPDPLLPVD